MSNPSTASKIPLDSVSFIFGQVISQIDYLFESGHLSQENYSTIAAALLQNTPSSTPPQTLPAPNQSGTITTEPSHYGSGYFPTTSDQHIPPPSQIGNVSSQSSSNAVKKASTPSLLSFRSKSSKGKSKTVESPLPTTPFEEAEEPQLGRINKGVRSALQGGFVLSQIVDQALTLTPGVPEGLRESIVERVEEGSREYVRKATDPRQQALWRQNAQRAGSSAWKVARGGGGTSRASGQIYRDTPTGSTNAETGEFSIIASGEAPTVGGQPGSSTSSVHSFFAGPSINVTTVVTVSFLDGSLGTSLQDSGFAVNQPSHLEQVAPMTAPSNNQNARPSAQAGYAVPRAPGAPPPGDPGFISGREW